MSTLQYKMEKNRKQNCSKIVEKFIEDMERIKFDYSYKNIPIPSVRNYKLLLIEKIELVIKRMSWKDHFYNKEEEGNEILENYGLESLNCLSQIKKLSYLKMNYLIY